MLEVILCMGIFTMITLLFSAVVPITLRETQQSGNYSEAALLAQHKLDQFRTVSFASIGNSTSLISSGIIDAVNSDGSYDFSATSSDNLSSFFPAGTTGTIVASPDTSTGTMSGGVYDITVTITWPTSGTNTGSVSLEDKVINY